MAEKFSEDSSYLANKVNEELYFGSCIMNMGKLSPIALSLNYSAICDFVESQITQYFPKVEQIN